MEPFVMFEKKTGLCVMSSLSKIDALGKTNWNKFDADENSARTRIAEIQILAPKQSAYLLPIHPSILEKHENLIHKTKSYQIKQRGT